VAKPIVNGIPEQTNESVEVIHLNLLVGAGREAAGQYGIRMVPATVLLNNQGDLLDHQTGRPDASRLIGKMGRSQD
jgi:hypothetical protein